LGDKTEKLAFLREFIAFDGGILSLEVQIFKLFSAMESFIFTIEKLISAME
jgi:hypothetical protein